MDHTIMLSRYEIARLIGLRALQIEEGSAPFVQMVGAYSPIRIASQEILERKIDALVNRGGVYHSVKTARYPIDLDILVNTLNDT